MVPPTSVPLISRLLLLFLKHPKAKSQKIAVAKRVTHTHTQKKTNTVSTLPKCCRQRSRWPTSGHWAAAGRSEAPHPPPPRWGGSRWASSKINDRMVAMDRVVDRENPILEQRNHVDAISILISRVFNDVHIEPKRSLRSPPGPPSASQLQAVYSAVKVKAQIKKQK